MALIAMPCLAFGADDEQPDPGPWRKKKNLEGAGVVLSSDSEIKRAEFSLHCASGGETKRQTINLEIRGHTWWCNDVEQRQVAGVVKRLEDWQIVYADDKSTVDRDVAAPVVPAEWRQNGFDKVQIQPGRVPGTILQVRVLIHPGNSPDGTPDTSEPPQLVYWVHTGMSSTSFETWQLSVTGERQEPNLDAKRGLGTIFEDRSELDMLSVETVESAGVMRLHRPDEQRAEQDYQDHEITQTMPQFPARTSKIAMVATTIDRQGAYKRARGFHGTIIGLNSAVIEALHGDTKLELRVDNKLLVAGRDQLLALAKKQIDSLSDITVFGQSIKFLKPIYEPLAYSIVDFVDKNVLGGRNLGVGSSFAYEAGVGGNSPITHPTNAADKGAAINEVPGYTLDNRKTATVLTSKGAAAERDTSASSLGNSGLVEVTGVQNVMVNGAVQAKFSSRQGFMIPGFTAELRPVSGLAPLRFRATFGIKRARFEK